jgi:hypothetical protein
MTTMDFPKDTQAQRIQRWAWGLGFLALALFVGFIALCVMQSGAGK